MNNSLLSELLLTNPPHFENVRASGRRYRHYRSRRTANRKLIRAQPAALGSLHKTVHDTGHAKLAGGLRGKSVSLAACPSQGLFNGRLAVRVC